MKRLLVIGSALRDVCESQAALGLTFVGEAWTAPKYRLYSVDDSHAALVEDTENGVSVRGELVDIADDRFQEILASEPPGITQEPVELLDGQLVMAAFGDPEQMAARGRELTDFADFAAYFRSLRTRKP